MKKFISFLLLLCLILSLFSAPGYAEAADDLTSIDVLPSTSEYYNTDTDSETKTVDMLSLTEERAENTFTMSDEVRFESCNILYPMLCRTFTNMYFKSGYITWDDKKEKDFTYFTLEYKLFYNEGEAPAYETINVSITEGFSLSEGSVVRNGTYPCFKREDTNKNTDYVSAYIKVFPLYSKTKPEDLRVNGFPAIPIIDLSYELSDDSIEMYETGANKKIDNLTYTFGSYSWIKNVEKENNIIRRARYNAFDIVLQVKDNNPNILISNIDVSLPDGFSFEPDKIVSDKKLVVNRQNDTDLVSERAKVYPLYSDHIDNRVTYTYNGVSRELLLNVEENQSAGSILMRPTREVDHGHKEKFEKKIEFEPIEDFILKGSGTFSDRLSMLGCTLSQAVYNKDRQETRDDTFIWQSLNNLGFGDVDWHQNDSPYGVAFAFARKKLMYQGKVQDLIMVVVRGTVDTEWIGNFDILDADGETHKNFSSCANTVNQELRSYLTNLSYRSPDVKIFICGHSRGAAVSNLLAHDLSFEFGSNNVWAYTFATPNCTKSKSDDMNIYNFVYMYDVVGLAPYGYDKHGTTYYVGGKNASDAPDAVKAAFSRYTDGNNYDKGVGSGFFCAIVLILDEDLNFLANLWNMEIGKFISNPDTVEDNWLARGHGAENYVAWAENMSILDASGHYRYTPVIEGIKEACEIYSSLRSLGRNAKDIRTLRQHNLAAASNYITGNRSLAAGIHCPVDVTVKDPTGNVIVSFVSHVKTFESGNEVLAIGDGESSYFAIPEGFEYELVISGTGEGELSLGYTFMGENNEIIDNYEISNVPISNGRVITLKSTAAGGLTPVLTADDGIQYRPQSDLLVSEENFPDTNFRTSIRAYDTDGNGSLSNEELLAVTTISCANSKISSLKGIEYFTALKKLYCNGNNLTALDVSKNSMLELLACNDNQLTNLDVSKNTKLKKLYCYKNKLTALDISGCNALETLSCYGNQLTVLDTSQSKTMNTLDCSDNYLGSLDLSNNDMLDYLSCANNRLTMLDVGNSSRLTKLYCYDNKLTTLNFTGCIALELLSCYNNALTALDVGQCPVLQYLYCYDNQLSRLDVSKCAELVRLDCYRNKLLNLDTSKNGQIEELACSNNQLASLNIGSCTALNWLNCSNNQLTELDISQAPVLETAACSNNKLAKLTTGNSTTLKRLDCSGNQLTGLVVSGYPMLESLVCHDNRLTALDLTRNSALRLLESDKNNLDNLNISNCPTLVNMANGITPIRQDGIVAYIGSTEEENHQWLYFDEGVSLIIEYVADFVLPAFLTEIEEEAFSGGAFTCVLIPETVTSISSKAFADCPNLTRIVFVNGNLDVAADFVSGCPTTLVIEAPEGSTVADNLELYFRYICPMPEDPGRPGDDDCPEEPETGRIQEISKKIIPPGAGDEEGGFAVFE